MVAVVIDLAELERLAAEVQATTHAGPWRWDTEPREHDRRALKSSVYTVFTVGRYYDGGSDEQEAALAFIAACSPEVVTAFVQAVLALREVISTCAPPVEALLAVHGDGKYINPETVLSLREAAAALRDACDSLTAFKVPE